MNAVIACGGTGGHLFPGIAVAEVLQNRGHEVMLLVSEKDIDALALSGRTNFQVEKLPTVGNFSTRNSVRLESATVSISFSEINSITLCPRFCSTSATAIPGNRCPPVPPHAITAFIAL